MLNAAFSKRIDATGYPDEIPRLSSATDTSAPAKGGGASSCGRRLVAVYGGHHGVDKGVKETMLRDSKIV